MNSKLLITILITAILAIAIPVSLRVSQQQTQLKSQAAVQCSANNTQYNAGDIDYVSCRACQGDGSWGEAGSDYGPGAAGSTNWCNCAKKYRDDLYQQYCTGGGGGGGGGTGGGQCAVGTWDADKCAKCGGTPPNTFWGEAGSDYGPGAAGSTSWCACAQKDEDKSLYEQYCTGGGGSGGSGSGGDDDDSGDEDSGDEDTGDTGGDGPSEGSLCEYKILDANGKDITTSGPIYPGDTIIAKITTTNNKDTPWSKDKYKLKALEQTANLWTLEKEEYALPRDIKKDGAAVVFDVKAKAKNLAAGENFSDRDFIFGIAKDNKPIGAVCSPQLRVLKRPADPISTSCYALSEDANEVRNIVSCDDDSPIVHPYTNNPITYKIEDSTPGEKNIYVIFFDNLGNKSNSGIPFVKKVILSPDPVITNVVCSQTGTIEITGKNFGEQGANGKAKVKAGSQDVTISDWTSTKVTATTTQKLEGNVAVSLVTDEGKTLNSTCRVDTTTLDFTAGGQCKIGGTTLDNVDVKIFQDNTAQSPTQPFLRQSIKIDKNGKPSGLTSKLEVGKNYVMILKGRDTLARKVNFTAFAGTTVIPEKIILPVGDIAPRDNPDGKINVLDTSELKTQWSLIKDVVKNGDLNADGRINSLDYSCLLQNLNKEDDIFTPTLQSLEATDSAKTKEATASAD